MAQKLQMQNVAARVVTGDRRVDSIGTGAFITTLATHSFSGPIQAAGIYL